MSDQTIAALSAAIEAGDGARVRALLARHPDLLGVDWGRGRTWLHKAAELDSVDVVAAFVDAGLDVNATLLDEPETPLHVAVMSGSIRVAEWLLQHGANVNAGGGSYPTPLSFAASEDPAIVRMLVEHGADVNRCHGYPVKNPRFLAWKWKKVENESFLRAHGALFPWELPEWSRGERHRKEIARHLEDAIGPLIAFPREKNDPVDLFVCPPTADGPTVILVTAGVSEHPAPRPVELLFELPGTWPATPPQLSKGRHAWAVEWIRTIVESVMTGKMALAEGDTMAGEDPSEPLGPGVKMSALLFVRELRPFGRMRRSDGVEVTFLSLFPIYESELKLAQASGFQALVKAFQAARIPTKFDPSRPPAV